MTRVISSFTSDVAHRIIYAELGGVSLSPTARSLVDPFGSFGRSVGERREKDGTSSAWEYRNYLIIAAREEKCHGSGTGTCPGVL